MPTVASVQTAVTTVIDTLNAVLAQAQTPVTPSEFESAEGALADAQAVEGEMQRSAAIIVATLKEIQAGMALRTATVRDSIKIEALERVAALLKSGALSLDDVVARLGVEMPAAAAPPDSPAKAPASPGSSSGKYMNPDKYRNPHTGETWSGRGPAPKWLKALAVDGKTIEDFRIDAPANMQTPATASTAPAPAEPSATEASAAPAAAPSDIGDTMSFDGNLDDDIGGDGDPAGQDSDIGEMLTGLQAAGTAIKDGLSA
jgi:hypothetical protein